MASGLAQLRTRHRVHSTPGETSDEQPKEDTAEPASSPASWYTAESLRHVNPLQTSLELTAEARQRGMVFLVVEVEVPPEAVELKRLIGKELEEFQREHMEMNAGADVGNEVWRYQQDSSQFKIHTMDGSTYTAGGFQSGNAFWPVGGLSVTLQSKPEMLSIGVFFTIEGDAVDAGDLMFQIKRNEPIRLARDNRSPGNVTPVFPAARNRAAPERRSGRQ